MGTEARGVTPMTVRNISQPVETVSGGQRPGVAVARAAGIPVSHDMRHAFEVASRIHVHRRGRRPCVIRPKGHAMSDAVASMTGARVPDVELEPA